MSGDKRLSLTQISVLTMTVPLITIPVCSHSRCQPTCAHHLFSVPSIDLIARLTPELNAAYDCGPRADSKCFEGTRIEVVRKIDDWASNPDDRRLCLLDGPAGFGKSAIARTVAHRWDISKQLVASFLFLP